MPTEIIVVPIETAEEHVSSDQSSEQEKGKEKGEDAAKQKENMK